MHWEDRLRELAGRQGGAVARYQLASIGCDSAHWGRARRNGRWELGSKRVLYLRGSPATTERRVWASVLDAGRSAYLHGRSALAWMGLPRLQLDRIEVARCRGGRNDTVDLANVHHLRDVDVRDLCLVHGVPSVTALRAIWSEASRFGHERWHERGLQRIGRLLDDANGMGLVTWSELHDSVERLQRSGRAGTTLMRELAVERQPGTSATESRNEDRLEQLVAGAGLARLERQKVVGGATPIGRVDHRDTELPVVIETNSLRFHASLSDQRDDEQR